MLWKWQQITEISVTLRKILFDLIYLYLTQHDVMTILLLTRNLVLYGKLDIMQNYANDFNVFVLVLFPCKENKNDKLK